MTVAAIDIGTNSTRLLLADAEGGWIDKRAVVTRLGEGVDATGEFGAAPMARTWAVLASYAESMEQFEVSVARVVTTSAARDAGNREVFLDRAEEILGHRPEVIGGDEEAGLAFAGARANYPSLPGPFAVIDVGGGSTEVVVGNVFPDYQSSFDIGSVRMSERVSPDRPMTAEQWSIACAWAREVFDEIDAPAPASVIGVAGTFTSLAGIHLQLDYYDPVAVEGAEIGTDEVWALAERLAGVTTEAVSQLPSVDPARAYVLPAGSIVAASALSALGAERVIVSEHDNLDGIVAGLLGR